MSMENSKDIKIIRSNFSNNVDGSGGVILIFTSQSIEISYCIFLENLSATYGGTIYIQKCGNASILGSFFYFNSAMYGGAIYAYKLNQNSLFEITDCAFIENNSTSNGGAIDLATIGNTSIIRCNFSHNSAIFGGAVLLYNVQPFSMLKITECIFIENNSTNGGSVYMEKYATLISKSSFANNFAQYGGAIFFAESLTVSIDQITDCVFFENNSTALGAAIYIESNSNTSMIRNIFSNNLANYGGAILLSTSQSNSLLIVSDCLFIENYAKISAGALFMDVHGNAVIIRSNFSNNFEYSGGVIFLDNSPLNSFIEITECVFSENNSTSDGGVFYMRSSGNISVIRSIFSNNFAYSGSAISLFTQKPNSLLKLVDCIFNENNTTSTGAIYLEIPENVSIFRSNFSKNLAGFGGAVFLANSQKGSFLEIVDCGFLENDSPNGGAIGMKHYGNTSIINTYFSKNYGGSYGGAIFLSISQSNSTFEIIDCVFLENIANTNGGAIYIENFGNTLILKSEFTNNFAAYGGALFFWNHIGIFFFFFFLGFYKKIYDFHF